MPTGYMCESLTSFVCLTPLQTPEQNTARQTFDKESIPKPGSAMLPADHQRQLQSQLR